MYFGFLDDGRDEGEHNGFNFVEISKMFPTQVTFLFGRGVLGSLYGQ